MTSARRTALVTGGSGGIGAAVCERLARDGLGSAADVANALAFLVSDQAGWITGQTLMVDGGYAL